MNTSTMSHLRIPTDEEYLNDFHKKWNEACMRERERTQSMHFSHEYAKAQSDRLDAHCRMSEEEYSRLRTRLSRGGR